MLNVYLTTEKNIANTNLDESAQKIFFQIIAFLLIQDNLPSIWCNCYWCLIQVYYKKIEEEHIINKWNKSTWNLREKKSSRKWR